MNPTYRLTPAYAAVLAFMATLVVHCGSGPDWQVIKGMSSECRASWWRNLLYINNLEHQEIRSYGKEVSYSTHNLSR